jgi:hypothetical protein
MLRRLGYRFSALIRSGIVAGISSLAMAGIVEVAQAVTITGSFTIQGFTLAGIDADGNAISGASGGKLFVSFVGQDTVSDDVLSWEDGEFTLFQTESFGFSEAEANFILNLLLADSFEAFYNIATTELSFSISQNLLGGGLKLHSFESGAAQVTINDPLVGLDYDLALSATASNATITPGIDREPIPWQTDVATGASALVMAGLAYNRFRKKASA